jgi:hypothetical protein
VTSARAQYTAGDAYKLDKLAIPTSLSYLKLSAVMASLMLQRRCSLRALQPSIRCQASSVARCPFANFSISPPAGKAKPKPSPLDQADAPNIVGASFWLAAGKPGQDVPGKLVSGIHRLYEVSCSSIGYAAWQQAHISQLGLLLSKDTSEQRTSP